MWSVWNRKRKKDLVVHGFWTNLGFCWPIHVFFFVFVFVSFQIGRFRINGSEWFLYAWQINFVVRHFCGTNFAFVFRLVLFFFVDSFLFQNRICLFFLQRLKFFIIFFCLFSLNINLNNNFWFLFFLKFLVSVFVCFFFFYLFSHCFFFLVNQYFV